MKTLSIILLIIALLQSFPKTMPLTSVQYLAGRKPQKLIKDPAAHKKNHRLNYCARCAPLKDSEDPDNFYEYNYVGDIDSSGLLKVIQKEYYNGDEYLLIDTRHHCRATTITGKPFVFGRYIFCGNQTETTDKECFIQVWQIGKDNIKMVDSISLHYDQDPVEFRLLPKGNLSFKDYKYKCWQINKFFTP